MIKRHCPICQNTQDKLFNSFGINPREDAQCNNCGSLERHRLLWYYIKEHTQLFQEDNKKFLHIAPERILSTLFSQHLGEKYLSVDLSNPRAMIQMDITDIHYEENSFDYIYCSHVLEHIVDDKKAMRELLRVLKKDGWAILLVPIQTQGKTFEDKSIVTPEERLKAYGHPEHVRNYGNDYALRLQESGFYVKTFYPKDILTSQEIELYGVSKAAGEIYFCTKQEHSL